MKFIILVSLPLLFALPNPLDNSPNATQFDQAFATNMCVFAGSGHSFCIDDSSFFRCNGAKPSFEKCQPGMCVKRFDGRDDPCVGKEQAALLDKVKEDEQRQIEASKPKLG
jgi:hypothetical protein